MEFEDKLLKKIKSIRSYNKLYNLPMDMFHKANKKGLKPENVISTQVKILILNATCNGFGDIIFALKLFRYLKEWYGDLIDVKIATNNRKRFLGLIGEDEGDNVIRLQLKSKNKEVKGGSGRRSGGGEDETQCKRFHQFMPNVELENFDLYLVAPLTADFKPDFKEIHKLVKNSNRFNTAFLTEYNMPINKDILFNVGVGKKRDGLFLINKPNVVPDKIENLDYPYSIIYVAQNDDYLENCYEGYLELLTSKFKLDRLDIVVPPWLHFEKNISDLFQLIDPHYSKISIIEADGEKELIIKEGNGKGEIVIRFDIFPLSFEQMIPLYYHSLPIMLLTGDQSFTDGLSIRKEDSVIFYQGLPWKQNFYTSMAKDIPNKFFKSYKTSCGNANALRYKPNLSRFANKNDFRVKAKAKMDALIMSVGYKSDLYTQVKHTIAKSKDLRTVKKKLIV
jgi:hypothetical protein